MGCPRCGSNRVRQTPPTVVSGGASKVPSSTTKSSDPASDSSMGRARVEIMRMGLNYVPTNSGN